jgi:hypothetical protein
MHVAIVAGTFLLGGWVLDPPADEQQAATSPVQRPIASAPLLPPPSSLLDQNRLRTTVSSDATDRMRDRTSLGGQTPGSQQARSQGQGTAGQLPMLPTEPLPPEAEGTLGQPTPPTANAPLTGLGGRGAGGLSTATGPLYGPMAPTTPVDRARSPWSPGYRASSSVMNQQYSRAQTLGGMSVVAPPTADKAFAGYRPTSGVSPYLNLFRRDNLGTVDNYSTLVRPQLDQRNMNQQFNRDIGANRSAIMQGSMLQQSNNASRTPEGVGTPQFYMNYGSYYPGQ